MVALEWIIAILLIGYLFFRLLFAYFRCKIKCDCSKKSFYEKYYDRL